MFTPRRRFGPVAAAAAVGIAGCGRVHSDPVPTATPNPCLLSEAAARPSGDTVVLALLTPLPGDDRPDRGDPASRFLRALRDEPLVRVDCRGKVIGALATSWRPDETRATWTFAIEPGRRSGDGSPLDAAAIRQSWLNAGGDRGGGGAWPWAGIAEVIAPSPEVLRVRLLNPSLELPDQFADPGLAVPGARAALGPVRVVVAPSGADPRDLIDPAAKGRIDLMFSRDPATIDYARSRAEWRVVPLPWDRVYLLATPSPEAPDDSVGSALIDAVRGEARVASEPSWWRRRPECLAPAPSARSVAGPRPEIAYLATDPTARQLAERLVALAGGTAPDQPSWLVGRLGRAGSRLRAVSLDPSRLAVAIESGQVAGAVVADPRELSFGCLPQPWSARAASRLPLLETRAHLIVRRDLGPLTIDRDGTVRLGGRGP